MGRSLLSLDEVLETMIANTARELEMNRRAWCSSQLEQGRVAEYQKDISLACDTWLKVLPEIISGAARVKGTIEEMIRQETHADTKSTEQRPDEPLLGTLQLDLRHWRELLHQCLFFLGSIYFQMENGDLEKE